MTLLFIYESNLHKKARFWGRALRNYSQSFNSLEVKLNFSFL